MCAPVWQLSSGPTGANQRSSGAQLKEQGGGGGWEVLTECSGVGSYWVQDCFVLWITLAEMNINFVSPSLDTFFKTKQHTNIWEDVETFLSL